MKRIFLFTCLLLILNPVFSQTAGFNLSSPTGKKGSFYFYWGYNRGYFSRSNLHFTGPNYDFTLYGLTAKDRPTKFGWVYFNPGTITIPQYVYRLGFHITDRIAISAGLDHMKYVVEMNQPTRISGVITPQASGVYAGSYLNEPLILQPDLLLFEHSDGLNLMTLDFEYLLPLAGVWDNKLKFYWNSGAGGIWVVTRTDVRVMGDGINNDFHVAGFTLTGKMGPRIEFKDRVFLLGEARGGYASLPAVLIKNAEPEIGDHNLTFLEWYIAAGVNFRLWKEK